VDPDEQASGHISDARGGRFQSCATISVYEDLNADVGRVREHARRRSHCACLSLNDCSDPNADLSKPLGFAIADLFAAPEQTG
jgi:hypothetical protein